MYWLYSLAAMLALLLSAPWWLLRMARYNKYRAGLAERLGFVPKRLCGRDVAFYVSTSSDCKNCNTNSLNGCGISS